MPGPSDRGRKEETEIEIWKNNRKPPFMDSEEMDLNPEKVEYAVRNMSYSGLQAMAVYGLLLLGKFKSPAEICRDLESLEGKKNGSGKRNLF